MNRYRFILICPKCNKESETVADKSVPPPRVNCGDCLMDRVDIVELKVLSVEVIAA
jgi:hypothetical protein